MVISYNGKLIFLATENWYLVLKQLMLCYYTTVLVHTWLRVCDKLTMIVNLQSNIIFNATKPRKNKPRI